MKQRPNWPIISDVGYYFIGKLYAEKEMQSLIAQQRELQIQRELDRTKELLKRSEQAREVGDVANC